MKRLVNRRQMLQATAAVAFSAACGVARRARAATVREIRSISSHPELYHGWPTLARSRRNHGQLLLVYSGGHEAHVCPFGRVEMMRSDDDGKTWGPPRVLLDCPIDDRDAGVLETDHGTILVTTFTSLAYEPLLAKAEKIAPGEPGAWPKEKLARWRAARDRLSAAERQAELGTWMIRSTDGGATWSDRYDCLVDSPHGPVQLSGGRLLYAGKELWRGENRVGVCESTDDGRSWHWLATLSTRPGDDHHNYHELHAVEAADGRIVVQLRNHNKANNQETLQSESLDGGRSWSDPHGIGVWGLPSHLVRLADGRLLMTYGHRRPPFGCQARTSDDHGRSWSEPIVVYGEGTNGDLGYPSTVQLADGTLVTAWYEKMQGSPHAVLRQGRWSLAD